MKTIISVVILTFFSFSTLGQITKDELDKEIKSLNQKILSLQNENTRIKKNSEEINRKLTTNNNKWMLEFLLSLPINLHHGLKMIRY